MIDIQENIPLSRHTTFRIGGPAKFFCEVRTETELEEAIRHAKDKKIAAFIMGGGSNILFSDNGFGGLVIKIASSSISDKPIIKMRMESGSMYLECWAGESLASIVKIAGDGLLTGLEWATGIPGTIGGAIRGNAGVPWGCIADSVESVKILNLENLKIKDYGRDECQFEYRNSVFKKNDNLVVISAIIKLQRGTKEEIAEKTKQTVEKRTKNQPRGLASPGSFFENPVVNNPKLIEKFEHECNIKCRDNKVPAGWLIDEAGLRGKKMGNIQVSNDHANFLVNLGGGKAEEVVMLASLIKQKVRDDLGVELREEVKYAGF